MTKSCSCNKGSRRIVIQLMCSILNVDWLFATLDFMIAQAGNRLRRCLCSTEIPTEWKSESMSEWVTASKNDNVLCTVRVQCICSYFMNPALFLPQFEMSVKGFQKALKCKWNVGYMILKPSFHIFEKIIVKTLLLQLEIRCQMRCYRIAESLFYCVKELEFAD